MSAAPGGSGVALWGPSVGSTIAARLRRFAAALRMFACVALPGALFGLLVAVADVNALYLCVSLIGCVLVLRDFRIGVVLLVLLFPISRSSLFPHEMLGIVGLNPLNLLLAGALGAYLLHALSDGSLHRVLPRPLLWMYIAPIAVAGVVGSRHVGEIPPFLFHTLVEFDSTTSYIRDVLVKPLSLVVYAVLVAGAVSRSERPEKLLVPALISIWIMVSMVIVFVLQSGISLRELGSSESRFFLSPLGIFANELGRLYAFAYAPLLFAWVEARSRASRLALLGSMALVVVSMVLTFSRGAFLAFVLINVLFLLWRRNLKTLLLFGFVAACVLLLLPEVVYDRVSTGFGQGAGSDTLSAGRINHIWLPLLPELTRSPIFGNGLSSILWSEPMRRGAGVLILIVGHAHNAYLGALLDMGIVGLVLVCTYFVHVWRGFRALGADESLSPVLRGFFMGAAAGLASLLVSYTTDSNLTPGPEQVFLWLAIGMMYGQRAKMPAKPAAGAA